MYIYVSIHYQRKKRAERRRDVKGSWATRRLVAAAGAAAWSSGPAEYAGHEQRELQKTDQHPNSSQGKCCLELKQQPKGLGQPSWDQSSSNQLHCSQPWPRGYGKAVRERDFNCCN